MKKNKLLLPVFLLLLAHHLHSQDGIRDTLIVENLEAVTISALRVPENPFMSPTSLSVADTAILKFTQGLALNEALASIPGVFVQNSENFAQDLRISIRGFGARSAFGIRGVKILADGIPESTPDGQGQVDNLDPALVESMELIRASAGALYGNAAGGVLNVSTLNFNPGNDLQASVAAGSFGFRKCVFSLRNGSANKLAWHLRAAHTKIDGFREHSRMKQWNLNAGLRYHISKSLSATLLANYVNSPLAEDPGSISLEQSRADRASAYVNNIEYNAGESVEQGRVAVILTKQLKSDGQLALRSYLTVRDFENRLPFQNGGSVRLNRNFYGVSLSYQVRKTLAGMPLTGFTGVEINVQEDDRQRFNNLNGIRGNVTLNQLESFNESGLFTTWRIQFSDPLAFRASLRYSRVKLESTDKFLYDGDDSGRKEYERLVPALNLTWRLNKRFAVFGGYTSGFETPTLNELTNNPLQSGGFNPELQPQWANTVELGLRMRTATQNISGELVLFYIDLENEIVPFELAQFPGRTFYQNSDNSERSGVELSFSAKLADGLVWRMNYTNSNFNYRQFRPPGKDYSGNRQPGIPRHLLWNALHYSTRHGFQASLQAQYTGKMYANDTNSAEVKGTFVVNGRIGREFSVSGSAVSVTLGLNNIFDQSYFSNVRINSFGGRFYEPAPGRNWFVRIKFSMAGSGEEQHHK